MISSGCRQSGPPDRLSYPAILSFLLSVAVSSPACLAYGPESVADDDDTAGADDDDTAGADDDDTSGDDDDTWASLTVEPLGEDFRCTPAGSPPFPGVLYNHGGLGDQVGGDLEGTCRALAEAGYLAYSKKRRPTTRLIGHLDDLQDGIDALRSSDGVDVDSLAILGFSRGGLLTLQASLTWPQHWQAVVLMAPAPGGNVMQSTLQDVSALSAPVLLQVSENDLFQADHVQIVEDVKAALDSAGKPYTSHLYPSYLDDGHELFWQVQEPYWSDLLDFLREHL